MPITYRHDINPYAAGLAAFVAHGQGQQQEANWRASEIQQQRAIANQRSMAVAQTYSGIAQQALAQQYRTQQNQLEHQQALQMLPVQERRSLNIASIQQRGVPWDDPDTGGGIMQMAQKQGLPVEQFVQKFDQDQATRQMAKLSAQNMEMGYTDDQMMNQKRFQVQAMAIDADPTLQPHQKTQALEQLQQRHRSAFLQQPVPRKSPFPKGQDVGQIWNPSATEPNNPNAYRGYVTRDHRGNVKPIDRSGGSSQKPPSREEQYGQYMANYQQRQQAGPIPDPPLTYKDWYAENFIKAFPDGRIVDIGSQTGAKFSNPPKDQDDRKLQMDARVKAIEMLTSETKSGELPDPARVESLTRMLLGEGAQPAPSGAGAVQLSAPVTSGTQSGPAVGGDTSTVGPMPKGAGLSVRPKGWLQTELVDTNMRPLFVPPGTDLEKVEAPPRTGQIAAYRVYKLGDGDFRWFDGYTFTRIQRLP